MSRLWIFSDLHQDWADNAWDPAAHAPDFDIAVVVGDVHMPLTKSLDWLADRLPGVPTIYVPGNHDFWWDRGDERYTLADQIARGRDLAARRSIHLLMDDAVSLSGTRFLGGTLWTNLRLGTNSLGHALKSSRQGMNDYKRIRRRASGKHKYVRPLDTLALHRATSAFLDAQLAIPCLIALECALRRAGLPHISYELRLFRESSG
jgi:predicted phosphohydrolase